jgi:uncharacterized surface protein with fasciclin (FAS1) repeats
MKKFLPIGVLAAIVVSVAGSPATARPNEDKNIVQTARAAGSFTTLTKLVAKAGLAGTLSKPGPYTVFAPTDAAFRKVPKSTLNALAQNKAKLRKVLLYHVVAGRVTSSDVVQLSSAKTLNGKSVRIRTMDGSVYINTAKVVKPDVMASNGVIHVINKVLIPPAR